MVAGVKVAGGAVVRAQMAEAVASPTKSRSALSTAAVDQLDGAPPAIPTSLPKPSASAATAAARTAVSPRPAQSQRIFPNNALGTFLVAAGGRAVLDSALNFKEGGLNLVVGGWRIGRGHGSGARQIGAGLVQCAFATPQLVLSCVEAGLGAPNRALWSAATAATGAAKTILTVLAAVLTLLLFPLRLVLLVASLPAQVASELGRRIAEALVGNLTDRSGATRSERFYATRAGSFAGVDELDVWLDHFKDAGSRGAPVAPVLRDLIALRDEEPGRYARLTSAMRTQGFNHFYRFTSLAQLERLLSDERPAPGDARPVCVVIAATADHNGVLTSIGSQIAQFQAAGYRVVYREASSEAEFAAGLRSATANGRANALVITGHGQPLGTDFGALDVRAITRCVAGANGLLCIGGQTLDVDDAGIMNGAASALAANAQIVLASCSTGGLAAGEDNLATALARRLPDATVYAPASDCFPPDFSFDDAGRISGVDYVNTRTVALSVNHGRRP